MAAAPTVDLHTHILPPDLPDLSARYGCGGFVHLERGASPGRGRMMLDGKLFREVPDTTWDPARRIEECDRLGVDLQVLSTVPVMFNYWAEPEHGLDLARRLNDHLAATVAAHPKRFAGLATLPLQAPDLAVRELERVSRDLGLDGVQIGTHVNGANLDDPALFPVFEAAQDLGAAIFVHPWDMLAPERMRRFWLPWLVGMPAELALAITSLLFAGVLERLPRLRIAFAHGGGAFPGTIGRIAHGFEARPDLCATQTRTPPRAMLARLYVDSLVHDEDTLRALLRLFGPERIALGTDYPFPLGETEPGALIRSLGDLPAAARARMLGGTALEFLDRDAAEFAR
ncbi:MAG TPA: amidohydrolase family protein [Candidatus Polarisedimenticolia bacterium]|nr:amidohydrolase family protein [Candidatus Polarisedimenticolia bacterium]